jgi:diketogulonate reductase-like aldo/keto reductase
MGAGKLSDILPADAIFPKGRPVPILFSGTRAADHARATAVTENDFVVSAYGVRMPRMIYGTAWKKDRTAALVEQAITLGFRGIDTACQPRHYHEAGVGDGLASCLDAGLNRGDLYLQSKFTPAAGQDPARTPYDPKTSLPGQVEQSFQVSLKNLRTDYLDCLVLHSPLRNEGRLMEVWRKMEAIFETGGTRQLGISNCYAPQQLARLYREAHIKPAVLQNRFYAETGYDREIRDFCRHHRMLYQAFWILTANTRVLAHGTLRALSRRYSRTPAQVFFRYLTQIDIIALTGTTSPAHMRDDLAIFDFELTQSDREALATLI